MTQKEIRLALSTYNFSNAFIILVSYKEEYTRMKFLIKSLANRTGEEEYNKLLTELKSLVMGSVVNGWIRLYKLYNEKNADRIEIAHTSKEDVEKAISKLTEKFGKLLQQTAGIYSKNSVNDKIYNIIKDVRVCVTRVKNEFDSLSTILSKIKETKQTEATDETSIEATKTLSNEVSQTTNKEYQPEEINAVEATEISDIKKPEDESEQIPHVDILRGIVPDVSGADAVSYPQQYNKAI